MTRLFFHKVDNYYSRISERGIAPNDEALNIDWIVPDEEQLMSEKDKAFQAYPQ